MVVFESLIVFDAETTSLPKLDHNTTKIIELAFIGCEIQHLKNSQELPRVLHKLVLLFNPNKPIQPQASAVSGLTNEALENLQPFRKEDVDMIKTFISRLPPPVCIVAHNGDNFDFPILRRALAKLEKELQNNVYCADSYKAFISLLPGATKPFWTRSTSSPSAVQSTPNHQETQVCNSNAQNSHSVARVLFPDEKLLDERCPNQDDMSNSKPSSVQTTPKHQQTKQINSLNYKNSHSRISFPDEEILLTKRPDKDDNSSKVTRHNRPYSFRLKDVYYFFYGGYFIDAHRAEDDAKALLSCIKKCEGFLDWMNKNAVVFNAVQPLF